MLISIDTNKWATMWQYTKQKGITRQVLNNWISRGKIKTKYIEELDLTLILINSETVKNKKTNGNNVEKVPNVASSQTEISDEEITIGRFMNWFIKHYSTATIDGFFGYVNAMGQEVRIQDILKEYKKLNGIENN